MHENNDPKDNQPAALHAVITGRVHGVGFRVFALDAARRFHLGGWVKNTPEGNVEVYAVGDRAKLEELLTALHSGPPAARVANVDFSWTNPPSEGKPPRFEVRN